MKTRILLFFWIISLIAYGQKVLKSELRLFAWVIEKPLNEMDLLFSQDTIQLIRQNHSNWDRKVPNTTNPEFVFAKKEFSIFYLPIVDTASGFIRLGDTEKNIVSQIVWNGRQRGMWQYDKKKRVLELRLFDVPVESIYGDRTNWIYLRTVKYRIESVIGSFNLRAIREN